MSTKQLDSIAAADRVLAQLGQPAQQASRTIGIAAEDRVLRLVGLILEEHERADLWSLVYRAALSGCAYHDGDELRFLHPGQDETRPTR